MSQQYRPATETELKTIYRYLSDKFNPENASYRKEYVSFVKKFYPKNAASALVSLSSEYNDETYSYSVAYVIVYDTEGNELPPIKGKSQAARDEAMGLPHPYEDQECWEERETEFVVYLDPTNVPDIFVKE